MFTIFLQFWLKKLPELTPKSWNWKLRHFSEYFDEMDKTSNISFIYKQFSVFIVTDFSKKVRNENSWNWFVKPLNTFPWYFDEFFVQQIFEVTTFNVFEKKHKISLPRWSANTKAKNVNESVALLPPAIPNFTFLENLFRDVPRCAMPCPANA